MAERLQKILSQWGIASRREAEVMIQAGQVQINGAIAQLGDKADPHADTIWVNGQPLNPSQRPQTHYLLLHKPLNVLSTCKDPQNRPTVIDLLPRSLQQGQGLHPVGRLDAESTGALLITNDGQLTCALTHPRYHVPKTYQVVVKGQPSHASLRQWRQGIVLSGRKTLPCQVTVQANSSPRSTQLQIVLEEGRNRQIRRVAEQLGHPVQSLHRTAIGPITLGNLSPGQHRALTSAEVNQLKQFTAIAQVAPP